MGRYRKLLYSAGFLVIIELIKISESAVPQCKGSITTASGFHAPKGKICTGDLIFYDNFEKLDLSKWEHESTMTGGGVRIFNTYHFQVTIYSLKS